MLALIKPHLSGAFAKLGTKDDTKGAAPQSADNRFADVWEYFVADFLCTIATKRKETAKKKLTEMGVLTKPAVGATETLYNKSGVQLVGTTKSPAVSIDRAMLSAELTKRFGAKKAMDIIQAAEKEAAPATVYSFILN